jgi:ribosome maturation factor RimP
VEDVVHGSYVLEVSSPGLERPFFSPGQMEAFTGQEVDVQLETPLPGFGTRRKFRGPLQEVAGDVLRVEVDGQVAELPWDRVKKAKLVHRFEEPAKPGKKKKKK